MDELPRPVWVSTEDGRRLPGWCRAVRRDGARRWSGFVQFTDRSIGLQFVQWVDEDRLARR